MAKKITKKAPKPTSEGEARVRIADLSQTERDSRCRGLIDELYGSNLNADEKSKRRQRLRTLDKDWVNTYASYIERSGYGKREEKPKVAKKVAKKAAAKKAAPAADATA